MLGDACLWGKGTKKDPVEALKWFIKSAAANRSLGLSGLAYMYRMGVGVEKDSVVAASLYSFAIEQGYGNYGHPEYAIDLGEMYEKAVSLYIKAYEIADTLGHKETKERAKQMLDKAKSN